MKTDIKAIIFDSGGVLLDWNPWHLYQEYFRWKPKELEDFLTEIDFFKWNEQQDKGRPFSAGIFELSARFFQHAQLIQTYFDNGEESVSGPISGTVGILKQLKVGLLESEWLLDDDSRHNIEVTKNLGVETIHFKSPKQLPTELKKLNLL